MHKLCNLINWRGETHRIGNTIYWIEIWVSSFHLRDHLKISGPAPYRSVRFTSMDSSRADACIFFKSLPPAYILIKQISHLSHWCHIALNFLMPRRLAAVQATKPSLMFDPQRKLIPLPRTNLEYSTCPQWLTAHSDSSSSSSGSNRHKSLSSFCKSRASLHLLSFLPLAPTNFISSQSPDGADKIWRPLF